MRHQLDETKSSTFMKLPFDRLARVMNLEEPSFGDNYIQEFVLEHLDHDTGDRKSVV